MRAYPRVTAHVIAESLGYASPTLAAQIIKDAEEGRPNYCEWVWSCYDGDARKVVLNAVRRRRMHKGYMAWYDRAYRLVKQAIDTGEEPLFGSWL
ncbi:MAG: hypothetical protein L0338_36785 [Acidobacteria bacterium]|nr:hypothetical protein [Acidobacteriota bacterium]